MDTRQFYNTYLKELKLEEKLELLELLLQSTMDILRKEKANSSVEEAPLTKEVNEPSPELTPLQKQLLKGPVMDEKDYALFQEKKEHFAQWK